MKPQQLVESLLKIATEIDTNPNPSRGHIAEAIDMIVTELSGTNLFQPLSELLALIRSAQMISQTYHWSISGPQFYGDHQLLQRIYEGIDDQIDGLGEKIVNNGGSVCPQDQSKLVSQFVAQFTAKDNQPDSLINACLAIETAVIDKVNLVIQQLESSQKLSDALDNFLQGLADEHDVFVYLLKQRMPA